MGCGKGDAIPQCMGSAVYGPSGCTCSPKPKHDGELATIRAQDRIIAEQNREIDALKLAVNFLAGAAHVSRSDYFVVARSFKNDPPTYLQAAYLKWDADRITRTTGDGDGNG